MSITDKVRYIRITDKVRYTRNTDFVYNGQKTLVPTGTLYARFTVYNYFKKQSTYICHGYTSMSMINISGSLMGRKKGRKCFI